MGTALLGNRVMMKRMTDREMLSLIELLLEEPRELPVLGEKAQRDLLSRLRHLLSREVSKLPAHRPREDTGQIVAQLVNSGVNRGEAIRIVVRARNKTEAAVKRAYERHQKKAAVQKQKRVPLP